MSQSLPPHLSASQTFIEEAGAVLEFPDTDEELLYPRIASLPALALVQYAVPLIAAPPYGILVQQVPTRNREKSRRAAMRDPNTPELCQQRSERRLRVISSFKSNAAYQQTEQSKVISCLPRPRTPDPSDQRCSKYQWERKCAEWRSKHRHINVVANLVAMGFDERNCLLAWEEASISLPLVYNMEGPIDLERRYQFALGLLQAMPTEIVTLSGSLENYIDLIVECTNMAGERLALLKTSPATSLRQLRTMLYESLGHPRCNLCLLLPGGALVDNSNGESSALHHLGLSIEACGEADVADKSCVLKSGA